MNDKTASFCTENWRFWSEWRDSFASAPKGADRGSHQCLHWWQQYATGIFPFDSSSLAFKR